MNDKVIEFLLLQNQLTQLRKIHSFYRGDNLENIYKRFGIIHDETEYNKTELLKRIFLIGDKSKYFYDDILFGEVTHVRGLGLIDDSDLALAKIFKKMNSSTKSTKDYIKKYFKKNTNLLEYFKHKKNREDFIYSVKNSTNPLFYRNYYLKILHQLYFVGYRNNSHFVSTSKDKEVTKKFAGTKGIIIHCWKPNFYFFRKKFEAINLPRQESEAFEEQKEFSFLAGILPHFISAVEFIEDEKVYFNPNILINEIDNNLFFDGLEIDQSNFIEVVSKTKFRKYFSRRAMLYSEYNINE